MKNILILLFALFAVALKADDRTVPGRTLSVTPQNALIHLPEFRKRSYKVFIQDEKGIWQPIEVRNALVSSFSKHPQIWNDWENQKLLRDTMSYALFVRDFAKNVKVRVEPCFRFRNVEIRPVSYGIDYKRVKGGIEFELTDASQNLTVTVRKIFFCFPICRMWISLLRMFRTCFITGPGSMMLDVS